ncbi:HPF/RaiA family ribosome-associated protein [Croceitalea rosinachiae]|uniref:HPF/RaiA family ribosome-associated protein n=1 Tax=Croceitalea rosinachiae TaxID=3075596 RepID=A0ABU3ACU9_9FLAO|nr:HPF/RaiA family ribosome-associated protein [Croceitalea sp. F388]MDT0607625.1 HPF/RaiA family ribosome-associated protein [Croceitalea sp. F388]
MEVIFEYKGVKASNLLEEKTLKKLNKLAVKYSFVVRAIVFFKTELTHSYSPTSGKICTIRLSVPGPLLFAESNKGDLESAMLDVIHELESQLSKKKGKMLSH